MKASMRITNRLSYSGYFWLPTNIDEQLPGTLVVNDGGEIELELIGNFEGHFTTRSSNISVILGIIEQENHITLTDCIYKYRELSTESITKSTMYVNKAFMGHHFTSNDITFNEFNFSIEWLDEWFGVGGIEVITDYSNLTASISYNRPDKININLENGIALSTSFTNTFPVFPVFTEAKITQRVYFTLSSIAQLPLRCFTYIANKIALLICLASDTIVSLRDVSAERNDIRFEIAGNSYPKEIKIYYPSLPFAATPSQVKWNSMLFRFNSIQERAEDVLNNWIRSFDTTGPSLNLYFSAISDSHEFRSSKFLALAQGLESYHRSISNETAFSEEEFSNLKKVLRKACPQKYTEWLNRWLQFGNEISYATRLRRIFNPIGHFFSGNMNHEKLIRKIVDTRNYLTHYNNRLETRAAHGKELWILCAKMEAIFQLLLLKSLGFSDEEMSSIAKQNYKLRQKLELPM